MENGFDFELYGENFNNCFIETSYYKNGNLQLSLYGIDKNVNEIGHIADISLNQDEVKLKEDEIVVDTKFKPEVIPQLKKLGILKKQLRMCILKNTFYAIYQVDFSRLKENSYAIFVAA